jgi:hypothetical protein
MFRIHWQARGQGGDSTTRLRCAPASLRMWSRAMAVAGVLLLLTGCRPRNGTMLVVHGRANLYVPGQQVWPTEWAPGEIVECEIDVRHAEKALLLCGDSIQIAWGMTIVRPDVPGQMLGAATTTEVKFHSSGHRKTKHGPTEWYCRKDSASIDCD